MATPSALFYERNDLPPLSGAVEDQLRSFLGESGQARLVCVSSGGTTVPLERRCVRFLDNFSRGMRGALCAEHFLSLGYHVIFLTRTRSQQPFERGLAGECFLNLLQLANDGSVEVKEKSLPAVYDSLAAARSAGGRLLKLDFVTVFDYLQLLRGVALGLQGCGRRAAFCLAAAVSDFYVPWSELPEHKIQSGGSGTSRLEQTLELRLQPVPKVLVELCREWAPEAFVISFKLETEERLLVPKAAAALEQYGVHLVVANELTTRMERVLLVSRAADGAILTAEIRLSGGSEPIECSIVDRLVAAHQTHIASTP